MRGYGFASIDESDAMAVQDDEDQPYEFWNYDDYEFDSYFDPDEDLNDSFDISEAFDLN
jgi:hypothetical protein